MATSLPRLGSVDKLDGAKPELFRPLRRGKPVSTAACVIVYRDLCIRPWAGRAPRACRSSRADSPRARSNLQAANARRDRDYIEQFDGLVHVHGKIALGGERGHSAANVAGERLQFFYRDELNFSLSRHSRQRLQVQFLIAGDHRQADSIAVTARDQRLENPLRRQCDLGGNRFRG